MRQSCQTRTPRGRANDPLRPPDAQRCGLRPSRGLGLLALTALFAAGFETPCHASPGDEDDVDERIAVAHRATDLTDPSGARNLLRRLDGAALQACGLMNGSSLPVREAIERSECHRDSLRRSVAGLGSPLLTRLAGQMERRYGLTQEKP